MHPQRSVITRAVGTDPDVDVDDFTIEAEDGDIFLICSDGLSDMVDDEEILELVLQNRDDLDKAVKALVGAANRGGGEDNITAVAFRISPRLRRTSKTAEMPAITGDEDEPDEETREYFEERAGGTMIVRRASCRKTQRPPSRTRRCARARPGRPDRARPHPVVAALVAWWLVDDPP